MTSFSVSTQTISHTLSPATPNSNGWYKQDVAVDFTCADSGSGIDTCAGDTTLGEGANQTATGTATDNAGHTKEDTTPSISIDKTAPAVNLVGGPAAGGSYYFGSVPAAPTCSASDGLSGLDGACSVSGYGTGVGSHTVTATAKDMAGNTTTSATVTYNVRAWTLNGFYQPTDMNGVLNTVKAGATVPLKFEVFAGTTELTDVSAIKSFTTKTVTCGSLVGLTDDIEVTTTGGTVLRYDATGGQFIQNWQTPKAIGVCYVVTMTTQDGSILTANFRTK